MDVTEAHWNHRTLVFTVLAGSVGACGSTSSGTDGETWVWLAIAATFGGVLLLFKKGATKGRTAAERSVEIDTERQAAALARPLSAPPRPEAPAASPTAELRVLREKYEALIERFFDIAERKVSVLDEYGEENPEALKSELQTLLRKISTREGMSQEHFARLWEVADYVPILGPWGLRSRNDVPIYMLACQLEVEFHKKHTEAKADSKLANVDLANMPGRDFETHVARLLSANGFSNVRGTPVTGDQGADVLAERGGITIVVQAKRYSRPVGNKAVQEVRAALDFYEGDEAWVVTNSTFTTAARTLAGKTGVRLIDGVALARLPAFLKRWPDRSA